MNDFNDLISTIIQNEIISEKGIIVLEHSILKKAVLPDNLKIEKNKVFGATQVDFIIKI